MPSGHGWVCLWSPLPIQRSEHPVNYLSVMTLAMLAGLGAQDAIASDATSPLQGTWTLVAADKLLPGGVQTRDYGESPKGRLIVDERGRYSLQIFKAERTRFAGDKNDGTAAELASAVKGSSTHYGTIVVYPKKGLLTFAIEGSSFPNWEGSVQHRGFRLEGETLRWQVPARPDGSIPISIWKRVE